MTNAQSATATTATTTAIEMIKRAVFVLIGTLSSTRLPGASGTTRIALA